MSQAEKATSFIVSKNDIVVVVSYFGALNEASVSELERCRSEIEQLGENRYLILNFLQATNISSHAIPPLAQIQRLARAKEMKIRICGLAPEVKEKLTALGVVRMGELAEDLQSSLTWIKQEIRLAAAKADRLGKKSA